MLRDSGKPWLCRIQVIKWGAEMSGSREALRDELLQQLHEMEDWESVQGALNKALPNDSDETDYEKWLEGSKQFLKDNEEVLKAMVR
jgi:hypothetical protein